MTTFFQTPHVLFHYETSAKMSLSNTQNLLCIQIWEIESMNH